jgi:glutamine amidotransferase
MFTYFVHSYHAADVQERDVLATCAYGYGFVCGVRRENIVGLQFHPEKSGEAGLRLLGAFCDMTAI